jgi:O-acetyl-ADP-ribose deacetylase (regulator of RNase III)
MGSMGAGIALEFRRRWPEMFVEYRSQCSRRELQPGGIQVFQARDRTIINLATQRSYRRGAARLEWVRAAAQKVAQLPLEGLALPRIASGLGGLQWPDVRAVLEDELSTLSYVEFWTLGDDLGEARVRTR